MAVLGGAKVSDKIEVVENLMKIADAHADRRRHGLHVFEVAGDARWASRMVEADKIELAARVLADAKARNFRLLLPSDHVVGAEFQARTPRRARLR